MQEKWMIYGKKADFNELAEKFNIEPVIARIIRNRDIILEKDYDKYLNGDLSMLNDPYEFKDMDKAVDIILNAIKEGKNIRVIGDYDIDGICSTYILVSAIEVLKAKVSMDIPDRIKDGYGINKNIIDKANVEHVEVIITCDNGIAAIEEIKHAKELGMTVVVTDHHEVPFEVIDGIKTYKRVEADAVVNHKQPDCCYPFKDLCGAGIAYKFAVALYNRICDYSEAECSLYGFNKNDIEKLHGLFDELLVCAAIATVGDVVSLKDENRIIVKEGLKILNESNENNKVINIGLSSLIKCSNLDDKEITSYHIGFIIGPCLNASGRLESAKKGYSLLREKNADKSIVLAEELVSLNNVRKEMTDDGEKQAEKQAEKYGKDKVLVIYLPETHESIAGIIAGRIREKYNKPTIILTRGDECIKGSGRSIENYDMFEQLNKVKNLLIRFGGHKMAAGLSLDESNISDFRHKLNEVNELTDEDMIKKVWIDVPVPVAYLGEKLIDDLSKLEPYGKDNEKPVFAIKDVKIRKLKTMGKNGKFGRFEVFDNGSYITAVMFAGFENFMQAVSEKYGEENLRKLKMGLDIGLTSSFVYYPTINEYMGKKEVQIVINGFLL